MAIYNGNKLAKKLYVGTKPVRAVYAGSRKVWPSVVRVARGVNYGAWTYADPVRRRTATPWEQEIYCDDSVGDVRYGATSTQEETATVSYTYGSWSYADPKRSRTKTTIYKYSDTTRTGGTVTETQTAATAVDWDGSTYWNGSCGSNYYYVDYKKVRTRYTYNDVTRYSGYYNGDSRSRRIEGSCGWVRDWRVVSDWANNGYTCNAAGTRGAYDCSGTYCVRYNQQQRTLSYCFPDLSGSTQTKVEYRAGSENSRAQEDGKCGYTKVSYKIFSNTGYYYITADERGDENKSDTKTLAPDGSGNCYINVSVRYTNQEDSFALYIDNIEVYQNNTKITPSLSAEKVSGTGGQSYIYGNNARILVAGDAKCTWRIKDATGVYIEVNLDISC